MKYNIQVRQGNGEVLETIQRKLWAESIGNFNPIFCTYKGKRRLVKSDQGDLSDPFRREEGYLLTLYILPRDKDGKLVETWEQAV